MHRLSVAVVVVSLMAAFVGCGGSDDPGTSVAQTPATATPASSGSPSDASSSTSPDTSPAAARAAYGEALESLLEADTGFVDATAQFADIGVTFQGSYRISTMSSDGGARLGLGDDRRTVGMRWIADKGWYREMTDTGAPLDDCLTAFTAPSLAASQDPLAAAPLGFPAALDVLLTAKAILKTDTQVRVQVDLHTLALVYGSLVPARLGIPDDSRDIGTIVVYVQDGRITEWTNTTVNFLQDVERAGHQLPQDLQGYESASFELGTVRAELTDPGKDATIEPPPAELLCR
jgi:hypothetical protein